VSTYRRAKQTDPSTSHEAAERGDQAHDQKMADVVLECHGEHLERGLTEYELKQVFAQRWTGGKYAAHSPVSIRGGLRDRGYIKWAGTWRNNPETDYTQTVWVLNPNPEPPPLYFCPTCGQKCLPERGGVLTFEDGEFEN
jgi:hypothetical protein